MLGVRPSGLCLRGTPSARITGAVRRDSGEVEEYTKSSSSRRTVPLDLCTAATVEEWLELKGERLREMGIRSLDGLPVVAELVGTKSYSTFMNEWDRFVGRTGFEDTRPHSLRHTFATLNLARGEHQGDLGRPRARLPFLHAGPVRRLHAVYERRALEPVRRQAFQRPGREMTPCRLRWCGIYLSDGQRWLISCGRRQVVRPQLPMLVSAGSNPVARSRDSDAGSPHGGPAFCFPSLLRNIPNFSERASL